MRKILIIAMLTAVAACGSKAKPADTTPDTTPTGDAPPTGDDTSNVNDTSTMVSPEIMDQVERALARKRDSVARCLSTAVDNKELPKSAHGKMVLEIVVAPSGTASSVKIVKSDLDSKSLSECVIRHVKSIEFPHVPKPYERSYTYGFEAD